MGIAALTLVSSFRAPYIYSRWWIIPILAISSAGRGILEPGRQDAGTQTGITSDYTRWPGGGTACFVGSYTDGK